MSSFVEPNSQQLFRKLFPRRRACEGSESGHIQLQEAGHPPTTGPSATQMWNSVSSREMGGVMFMTTAKPYLGKLGCCCSSSSSSSGTSSPDRGSCECLSHSCMRGLGPPYYHSEQTPRTLGWPTHLFPIPPVPSPAGEHLPRFQTTLNHLPAIVCPLILCAPVRDFSFDPGVIF